MLNHVLLVFVAACFNFCLCLVFKVKVLKQKSKKLKQKTKKSYEKYAQMLSLLCCVLPCCVLIPLMDAAISKFLQFLMAVQPH